MTVEMGLAPSAGSDDRRRAAPLEAAAGEHQALVREGEAADAGRAGSNRARSLRHQVDAIRRARHAGTACVSQTCARITTFITARTRNESARSANGRRAAPQSTKRTSITSSSASCTPSRSHARRRARRIAARASQTTRGGQAAVVTPGSRSYLGIAAAFDTVLRITIPAIVGIIDFEAGSSVRSTSRWDPETPEG